LQQQPPSTRKGSTTKAKRCTVSRNCSNGNKGNTENSLEQSSTLTAHDNRYDPNDFTSNRKSQIIYSDIFFTFEYRVGKPAPLTGYHEFFKPGIVAARPA
jgi:hypothetical protein